METIVEATFAEKFDYWLSLEDIAAIMRFVLNEPAGSFQAISSRSFTHIVSSHSEKAEFCLPVILNLNEVHWVLLWLGRHGEFPYALYHDSAGDGMPIEVQRTLKLYNYLTLPIIKKNQSDGHNCGIHVILNFLATKNVLKNNTNKLDTIQDVLNMQREFKFALPDLGAIDLNAKRTEFATALLNSVEYGQYISENRVNVPEASPPQPPPKIAPRIIQNRILEVPVQLDTLRMKRTQKPPTELEIEGPPKKSRGVVLRRILPERDWPSSVIFKDHDICVSTMKEEIVRGVIDIDSYLIMSTTIRSFNDKAVFTILNQHLYYKNCENVKALHVLVDHVAKMRTEKKIYQGLQFIEGHLANYGDDQIHIVFAVDQRATNYKRNLPNYMKFYVNKVVIPAIKSLPRNTETVLQFNETKPKIHVFRSEMKAFEKELEKRTRGYINGDQWLVQIFYYKAHHNMKSEKSIGLQEIKESIQKDPQDILFIQIHTGCVISHEKNCVLFDYERIREIFFNKEICQNNSYFFNKIGHFFANTSLANFPSINNIITYEPQQHKIEKNLYDRKMIALFMTNGLHGKKFDRLRRDITILRAQLLSFLDSVRHDPTTRVEIVETFTVKDLKNAKFPTAYDSSNKSCSRYSTVILGLVRFLQTSGAMVKIAGWSKYVHRSMGDNIHFLKTQLLEFKRPPTRSEVDRAYKLLELTIAFVDGRYARKNARVDLSYLQSIRSKVDGFFDRYQPDVPTLDGKFEKSHDHFKILPYDKMSYATYFECIYRCLKEAQLAEVDDISRTRLFFEFMAKAIYFLINSKYNDCDENLENFFESVDNVIPKDVTDHRAVYDSLTTPKHPLVLLVKSTVFGDRKALPPSALTFIKNHVRYWPTVFFNEEVKPTQWTKIVDTKEVRKTVATINANCQQRLNLVQYSEKRVTIKPAKVGGMVDTEMMEVVSFYQNLNHQRDQHNYEAQKLQIERKNAQLRELELQLEVHKIGINNLPVDFQIKYQQMMKNSLHDDNEIDNVAQRKILQPVRVNPFLKSSRKNPELVADLPAVVETTSQDCENASLPALPTAPHVVETTSQDCENASLPANHPSPQTDDEQYLPVDDTIISVDSADSKDEQSAHDLPETKKVDAFAMMMRKSASTSSKDGQTAKSSVVEFGNKRLQQPIGGPWTRLFTDREKRGILVALEKHFKCIDVTNWAIIAAACPNRNTIQVRKYAKKFVANLTVKEMKRLCGNQCSEENLDFHKKNYNAYKK